MGARNVRPARASAAVSVGFVIDDGLLERGEWRIGYLSAYS
jgi:hypothetical protein